ncbi:MAG: HD superfamily phosphohydrolase [Alteromonas naphthalenivorans]|jgi:HD superfamily phosphohydrolase
MNKKFLSIVLACSLVVSGGYYLYTPHAVVQQQSQTVKTMYGSVQVTEPVLLELLNHQAMDRLKHINQYGVMAFVKPEQIYTRHEHSLGVFYLLRTFGADLEEQVAGLLHDISHTAFSHIADFIHDSIHAKYSYQDEIFKWYLDKTGLLVILKKHKLERVANFGSGVEYKMLKDDLPNLCADRLEYNLYGGYVEGWLTEQEMRDVVTHLKHQDRQWVFTSKDAAQKFAKVTIDLSVQNWCSAENGFISTVMASILKRAFTLKIITQDDFHFSTDKKVWDTLRLSDDTEITQLFAQIDKHKESYTVGTVEKHDLHFKGKFRGVDPLVEVDGQLERLTEIDPEFAQYLQSEKSKCKDFYISYC